jgi:hypothetical protein
MEAGKLGSLVFMTGGKARLRIDENGDFFVDGRKVETDQEIMQAFLTWTKDFSQLSEFNRNIARHMNASAALPGLLSLLHQARAVIVDVHDARVPELIKNIDRAVAYASEGQKS